MKRAWVPKSSHGRSSIKCPIIRYHKKLNFYCLKATGVLDRFVIAANTHYVGIQVKITSLKKNGGSKSRGSCSSCLMPNSGLLPSWHPAASPGSGLSSLWNSGEVTPLSGPQFSHVQNEDSVLDGDMGHFEAGPTAACSPNASSIVTSYRATITVLGSLSS